MNIYVMKRRAKYSLKIILLEKRVWDAKMHELPSSNFILRSEEWTSMTKCRKKSYASKICSWNHNVAQIITLYDLLTIFMMFFWR